MQQHYELMVIFTPTLAESDYKQIIETYNELVTKEKAVIVENEPWGLKNLAYPIKKKTVGYYWLLTYKVNQEDVTAFDAAFRTALWRDENVLRYMITKLDKDALAYNLSRIEKAKSGALAKKAVAEQKSEEKKRGQSNDRRFDRDRRRISSAYPNNTLKTQYHHILL